MKALRKSISLSISGSGVGEVFLGSCLKARHEIQMWKAVLWCFSFFTPAKLSPKGWGSTCLLKVCLQWCWPQFGCVDICRVVVMSYFPKIFIFQKQGFDLGGIQKLSGHGPAQLGCRCFFLTMRAGPDDSRGPFPPRPSDSVILTNQAHCLVSISLQKCQINGTTFVCSGQS